VQVISGLKAVTMTNLKSIDFVTNMVADIVDVNDDSSCEEEEEEEEEAEEEAEAEAEASAAPWPHFLPHRFQRCSSPSLPPGPLASFRFRFLLLLLPRLWSGAPPASSPPPQPQPPPPQRPLLGYCLGPPRRLQGIVRGCGAAGGGQLARGQGR